jgi:DNA repair protein RadC
MPTYIHIAKPLHCADPGADARRAAEDAIIEQARDILMRRMSAPGMPLNAPRDVRDYLHLTLSGHGEEQFWCVMLDAQHRTISAECLFTGTLSQTSVYPREVVKAALSRNAACVIFAHNHPSGVAEPSHADELLTRTLKNALALVDVQVLDHFIVAGDRTLSFAERGLL